jgi:hypothetical protein
MIKKYRTGFMLRNQIDAVEVDRETEKSVWIRGSRSDKITSYYCYFDTWAEAHEYLVKKSLNDMSIAEARHNKAKRKHQEILSLKELSK